jgi:Ca-activated chloride channel family protein
MAIRSRSIPPWSITRVAVRDEKGRFVSGLTKDDFIVLDDGKEQTISYFSQETDQPLTVALVIDRSRSVQSAFSKAQVAARNFFSSVLRAGKDRAVVVAFDFRRVRGSGFY